MKMAFLKTENDDKPMDLGPEKQTNPTNPTN